MVDSVTLGPQQLSDLLWLASTCQQDAQHSLGGCWWLKAADQLNALLPSMTSAQLIRSVTALAACKRTQQLPASFARTEASPAAPPPHISRLVNSISTSLQSVDWPDAAILLEAAADLELCAVIPSLHVTLSSTIKSRADESVKQGSADDEQGQQGRSPEQAGCDMPTAIRIETALTRTLNAQPTFRESLLGLSSTQAFADSATTTTAAPTAAKAAKKMPTADQPAVEELSCYVPVWQGYTPMLGAKEAKEQLREFSSSSRKSSELALSLLIAAARHDMPVSPKQLERLWASASSVLPHQPADRAVVLISALSKFQLVSSCHELSQMQ